MVCVESDLFTVGEQRKETTDLEQEQMTDEQALKTNEQKRNR